MATVQLPADLPANMRRLPRDEVGRPIPFFAAEVNGTHDFRLMDPHKLVRAAREQLCWVCGIRLLRIRGSSSPKGTFVAGPMCLVNRTSAEPPSHADCAEWSAKACPFLTKPAKERREGNLPEHRVDAPGVMISRNPGVTALIASERWRFRYIEPDQYANVNVGGGVLCSFNRVTNVHWMTGGHGASAGEVMESIETGIGALIEIAETEPGAMAVLATKARDALRWVGTFEITDYPTVAGLLRHLP